MNYYEHQRKIIEKNPKRTMLVWDTGTGKSYAGLQLAHQNAKRSILIVCPKALKLKWQRDIVSHGTDKQCLVLTKEEFRAQYDIIGSYDAVIIDEAHYFSGMKSQMTKSLQAYIKASKPTALYLLTATPYMSTPWNVYILAGHLGHYINYIDFRLRFFYEVRMGGRMVPVIKPNAQTDIANLIQKISSVVKMTECVDVPEQVFEVEWLELNKKQLKLIKQVKETEINHIVKFTKIHQIDSGTLKSDGYTENVMVENDKLDRIMEYAETNPKLAIICRYNLQIDLYKEKLEEKGYKVFVIRGDTPDRDSVVQEIERTEKCIALINASCSEGYELPSIGLILFASLSFSLKDYLQMQGRFLRINKLKKNVYVHLVVKDSVDEGVYDAMLEKRDFDIEIYARKMV